ncbi:MAG: AI-2E family transporter [Acidimicrobiia bacterium]
MRRSLRAEVRPLSSVGYIERGYTEGVLKRDNAVQGDSGVPPLLRSASEVSWRLLVVAIAVGGAALLLARIWVVPLAVFVAFLLATALVETLAALLLALIVCFFLVKDGPALQRGVLAWVGAERGPRVAAAGGAAWRALGGYLRAAVLIGLFEATVIGLVLFFVGARLVIPVAVLTFLGAFLPVVGASLAGIAGAFLAVPLTAMAVAAWSALDRRGARRERAVPGSAS